MKIKNIVILLPLTLIFLSFFSPLTASQTRDFWLKTERKGTGFSYEHFTIRKLAKGKIEYGVDQHTKTDVAGLNPQDIIFKFSYIVDSRLNPISLDINLQYQTKKTHITGKVEKGVMRLTAEDELGKVTRRELAFDKTYFYPVLADLILKRKAEKTFSLKFFDPTVMKVDEVKVEVTKSDAEGVEAVVSEQLTMKYRIDRKGRIKEIEYLEMHSRSYLTDAVDAQNITYLNTADGYTLTIRSEKSFPNVYKVIHAQVQLKWKDIPFEQFNLEDNRQKVAKKTKSNREYEAILEITKPDPVSTQISAPVKEEKFAPFLADTEYIKPSDPSIQKQIAEIRGEETNAQIIVENILGWIQANIKRDLIAETLTGPEVLEKKRGKCSEYAIVFASLARAAGIPTLIALGEAWSGNVWMGHMWNEVWLGKWVAVDPSAGSFVSGPSHLKFIDSPTVIGTQGVRLKLVDNLSIEILDFKEEVEAASGIKTGIFGQTYFNKNFSCKISAPDESWVMREEEKAGIASLRIDKKESDVTFALVVFAVPPGMPAKTILDGRVNAISTMVKNFEKLEEGEIEVAGQKAPRVVFRQTGKDPSILTNENCLLVDGANGYLFAFITPKDSFSSLRASFLKILESFEIIR